MDVETSNHESLLDSFAKPAAGLWKALAEEQLGGAPFEKKLVTRTAEGIAIQPIYSETDSTRVAGEDFPGKGSHLRGSSAAGYCKEPWHIAQGLPYPTPQRFNEALLSDLARGQNAVNILLDIATLEGRDPDTAEPKDVGCCGVSIATVADFAQLLQDVSVEAVPIYVHAGAHALPLAALLIAWAQRCNLQLDHLSGSLESDPMAILAQAGRLPYRFATCMEAMAAWTRHAATAIPNVQTIGVSTLPYSQNGAHRAQEIACALATGVEYMRHLLGQGLDVDTVATRMRFHFSLSSHVFPEMAKLRAARHLWSHIVQQLGGVEDAQAMTLHGRTSLWNKTSSDAYNNMLRLSCETFAGILGGCQSIHTGTFDETFKNPDAFSRRIARNAQIILKEEFGLGDVIDPGGGSYYLETLTDDLARAAWAEFQAIERAGGMLAALQNGHIQTAVSEQAAATRDRLNQRRDVLVGVNQYAAPPKPLPDTDMDLFAIANERVAAIAAHRQQHEQAVAKARQAAGGKTDLNTLVALADAGATLGQLTHQLHSDTQTPVEVGPIQAQRLAQNYEKLHQASAQYKELNGHYPKVFLATMGPVRQHKARADFSQQFFQSGGFDVIYPNGFTSPEEAARAAHASGASMAVICSTDETYPDCVAPFIEQAKTDANEMIFILAGDPGDNAEQYAKAGLHDYISMRTNNYQFLEKYLTQLGVGS